MNKLNWCKQQQKGIELVEPNNNLSKKYFLEAEDTLKLIEGKKTKWELIQGYYVCYNSLYALLMKAGIKCEIHSCTIELMKYIEEFSEGDYKFLSDLKEKRIRAQYYLEKILLDSVQSIKQFYLKCKKIEQDLNIKKLRGVINEQEN